MKRGLCTLGLVILGLTGQAQKLSYADKAKAYVDQYGSWAIEEQLRSGIPASITLAQGIYETSAGESELATKANNHFGIKCKKEWRGETFAHTDDAPNECFRKYSCAKDSYKDHSDYLKSAPRYAALFQLEPTDYAGWAKGLKRCGYATNPQYAQKLIKMVEDFNLQEYTLAAIKNPGERVPLETVPQPVAAAQVRPTQAAVREVAEITAQTQEAVVVTEGVQLVNGIRAIYCKKGDVLLEKAMAQHVRYAKLLEVNELADEPLKRDMVVYLDRKNSKGAHATHTVLEGETAEQIAQDEGMHTRQLRMFNRMAQNEQPAAGAVLYLQAEAPAKPATIAAAAVARREPAVTTNTPAKATAREEYIATKTPAAAQVQAAPAEAKAEEEVEMSYGAQAPASLAQTRPAAPVTTPPVAAPVQQEEKATAVPEIAPAKTSTAAKEEEPQDELSRLKSQLDRVVYARESNTSRSGMRTTQDAAPATTTQAVVTTTTPVTQSNTPAGTPVYHTVLKGEQAYSIAKKYGITMKQLREWNGLEFDGGIKIGQKLRVK